MRKENQIQALLDGEIAVGEWGDASHGYKWIFINRMDNPNPLDFCEFYAALDIEEDGKPIHKLALLEGCDAQDRLRYATEEERRLLLRALEEIGMKWDGRGKKFLNQRWRARLNEEYLYVSDTGEPVERADKYEAEDDARFAIGNYFQDRRLAEEAGGKLKSLLLQADHGNR